MDRDRLTALLSACISSISSPINTVVFYYPHMNIRPHSAAN